MGEKYVKLDDLIMLVDLIRMRDVYHDWSNEYDNINEAIQKTIQEIKDSARAFN